MTRQSSAAGKNGAVAGAAEARAELQGQCSATEARMQAARKVFDRTRKPLEDTVRVQREELARRKVGGFH